MQEWKHWNNADTAAHVRFGSFCDIRATCVEVRLAPYSGRITRKQLTSASCHAADLLVHEQCILTDPLTL
jgi:hypothetical protein